MMMHCTCFLDTVVVMVIRMFLPQGGLMMDTGLFATHSFRVGWGPGWTLAHCGSRISSATSEDLEVTTKTFSFLPRPARTKP